ncbi:MAG: redoxin domain-containing protein [Sedimentisphaerales bacterium]|nr:redoxin domain-containing protein [Sedimentisphaerales bacterium]
MRTTTIVLMCPLILLASGIAFGMATEQIGPDSALGHPPGIHPDWPVGITAISGLASRVYSINVNGNENIYFKATPAEVNEIVALFSKARLRDHEVVITAERQPVKSFRGGDPIEYNVSLQIVAGLVLFMVRERESPTDLPLEPRLTLYAAPDRTLLNEVTWPKNLTIDNQMPGHSVPSGRPKPPREVYYGKLHFADGSPPVGFVMGVRSRITLWEQQAADGIEIGSVNNEGYFTILLSDQEMADLRAGRIWLTATISNYLTEARRTDQRILPETLVRDKEQAQPIQVEGPPYYYGRILFEDGTPPVLDPAPWPGAEIHLSFPYAGMARPDAEGYFKVMLSEAQFEKLSADKPRRNIYVPDMLQTGRSRATMTYPVSLLSQDKAKAGVVKIPRPQLPKKDLPSAESKVGKPVPGFDSIRFEGFQSDQATGKPLLVCFWDMDQRSSRQCIQALEKQKDALQAKGLLVLAIHCEAQSPGQVSSWLHENSISLTAGTIAGDSHDVLLAWGAKGAPWLVLTDARHVVTKEGFTLDELFAGR